ETSHEDQADDESKCGRASGIRLPSKETCARQAKRASQRQQDDGNQNREGPSNQRIHRTESNDQWNRQYEIPRGGAEEHDQSRQGQSGQFSNNDGGRRHRTGQKKSECGSVALSGEGRGG